MTSDDELTDVRRLLKETTDRALRAEMELELARREARELAAVVQARTLHVFGCNACHGEHRNIWTQEFSPAVRHAMAGLELELQRAYVCPAQLRVVLVSNESEETFCPDGVP